MNNKTVLITGASRGIGRAVAEIFSKNNYDVIINYNKSHSQAVDFCNELVSCGLKAEICRADMSKKIQVDDMINFILDKYKKIDILVNNAGISEQKLFTDISEEDWNVMINTNLSSAFFCSQSVSKNMISNKKGKIINISSIWGITGASCEVHYSVSKAGIIGLTKSLAKELGPSNIQVNCVAPGIVETDMMACFDNDELKSLKNDIPLMRFGSCLDIANCVYFLSSDNSSFITGQVISPNGGYLI